MGIGSALWAGDDVDVAEIARGRIHRRVDVGSSAIPLAHKGAQSPQRHLELTDVEVRSER